MKISSFYIFLTACFFCLFASQLSAQEVRVEFKSVERMDDAGQNLRKALNAWFAEKDKGIPSQWTKAILQRGESKQLDRDNHLLLLESTAAEASILVVSAKGPVKELFRAGTNRTLGPLDILLTSSNNQSASILYRGANSSVEYLSSKPHPKSDSVEILGDESKRQIIIPSTTAEAQEFSRLFLVELAEGKTPLEASKEAFALTPSLTLKANNLQSSQPSYRDDSYSDFADEEPWSAMVTFHVVRGSSSSLKTLNGSISYQNSGNTSDLPVRASGGGNGGRIEVGSSNDRFQATLDALESSGSVDVTSESFIRVPLGGEGRFQFQGINGGVDGIVSTKRVGRDGVELYFDQGSGDWGSFGVVSSRLRFKNGQTIEAAKVTQSRTTSSRSGPPILQDIPFIGAGVSSSSQTSSGDYYSLFITVGLE